MQIRALASNVRASAGIAVSGGANVPAGQRCLETLEQIAQRLDELTDTYGAKTKQTLEVLLAMENGLYVRVLLMRYIDWVTGSGRMPTWERMARVLHYDISYCKQLHREALRAFYAQKTRLYPTLDVV